MITKNTMKGNKKEENPHFNCKAKMAEPLNSKEVVSIEELAISNMYEIEVLIEVLARKEIVSKEEVLEEIKKMREK